LQQKDSCLKTFNVDNAQSGRNTRCPGERIKSPQNYNLTAKTEGVKQAPSLIMIHDIFKPRKSAIVIEAAFNPS